jgi:NTE family protein
MEITMNIQVKPHITLAERRLPFECVALVLQGGGALGSYQAGFYQALAEANIHPDWIAGISIGAINAAIIAGNPPPARVDRLRDFWTQVTTDPVWPYSGCPGEAVSLNTPTILCPARLANALKSRSWRSHD